MSFLITSITLLVLFSDSKCCKPGWLEFEDKCYWFSNSNLDWYRASSCCQALSSKLAEPLTTDAMNFMSSETITKGGSSSRMKELIEKQKFDGSWKFDNKLSQILKKSPHLMETSSVVTDKDVWATALAIAFLGKEFPDRKDEWEMLVEKALKWLKTRDTGGKDVVQEAMAFLST